MSLRVNTNVSALSAHRSLVSNSKEQAKTLEQLSSGLKVNSGADAPAQLQISEKLRAQAAGLKQAIDNTEMGVSLMQTAEGALDEVSRALINMRQLTVHAANEAVNDEFMLQSDQQEIDNIITMINRVALSTQYGNKILLDGSKSGNGVAIGKNLEFIAAGNMAQTSGAQGYEVTITQVSKRAQHVGTKQLNQVLIDAGEQLTISEGGRTLDFRTQEGHSVEQTLNELDSAIKGAGLNLELVRPDPTTTGNNVPQFIRLRHKEYGQHSFVVGSTTGGVLSQKGDNEEMIWNGTDVKGEINGESAIGRGQVLTGDPGAKTIEGVQMRYSGEKAPEGGFAGTLTLNQGALVFQTGGNADQTAGISLHSMRPTTLANGVQNNSGFVSLGDVNVLDTQKANDSLRMIDKAIEEVSAARGEMGAFQKNNLESSLNYLRIAHENVVSTESVIRDADIAEEMSVFTRNRIMVESATAMLAQANQQPLSVLGLMVG